MLGTGITKRTWSRAERIESPSAIPSRLLAQDPLAAVWGTVSVSRIEQGTIGRLLQQSKQDHDGFWDQRNSFGWSDWVQGTFECRVVRI